MAYVRYNITDRVGIVTLDSPQELNALSSAGMGELEALLDRLGEHRAEGDGAGILALVLTGAGKAFVAGANIRELRGMDGAAAREFSLAGNRLLHSIESFPVPVIAAVNGYAVGGGLELALAADLILAAKAAKFAAPEVTLGIMPGWGGIPRLAGRVGPARARELVLTGRMIDAEEGLRIGLVNRVVETEELMASALATAAEICRASPHAVRRAREYFLHCAENQWKTGLERELEAFGSLFDHPDASEGLTAFLEKRKPEWEST